MKIDHYISELLYDHDCVIVTDLGGFIANYQPASVNSALHVISPPSKKLAFNASLKNNDGLLANHIARRTLLNYTDASEVIRDYVKDATKGMKSGQKLKIDRVGILFFDNEERLQFLPDQHANYLVESFGMTPVHTPVIKRAVTEISEKEVPAIKHLAKSVTGNHQRERVFKWKVLEMIPAAAVLAILIMTPPVLKEFNSNLSTMLPFSRMNEFLENIKGSGDDKYTVTVPHINPFEVPPVHVPAGSGSTETAEPVSTTSEEQEVTETHIPDAPLPVKESPSVSTPADTTAVAVSDIVSNQRTYYVIGGCFRSHENAEKFISEMKLKGMDASIIGQNKSGLYMVSLFSSGSYNQTTDALPEIKSHAVESAWVYKR